MTVRLLLGKSKGRILTCRRDMTAMKGSASRSDHGANDKIIPYHKSVYAALRKCR